MMRNLLLCAGAVLACAAWVAPAPKIKAPTVAASMYAAGPNLWVKWTVAASPSDSLTVDLTATGQTALHRMYVVDSKTDSVSYPKPAPNGSITVSLAAKNWRGARSAAAAPASGTYVEPDTVVVPPVVQLQLIPASLTIAPNGTQQFCTIYVRADSSSGLVSNNKDIPLCQTAYQSWLSTRSI